MRVSIDGTDEFEEIQRDIRTAEEVGEERIEEQTEKAVEEFVDQLTDTIAGMGLHGIAGNPRFDRGKGPRLAGRNAWHIIGSGTEFTVRPHESVRDQARFINFGTKRYVDNDNPMVFQNKSREWVTVGTESNPHPGIDARHYWEKTVRGYEERGVLEDHLNEVADDIRRIIHDG